MPTLLLDKPSLIIKRRLTTTMASSVASQSGSRPRKTEQAWESVKVEEQALGNVLPLILSEGSKPQLLTPASPLTPNLEERRAQKLTPSSLLLRVIGHYRQQRLMDILLLGREFMREDTRVDISGRHRFGIIRRKVIGSRRTRLGGREVAVFGRDVLLVNSISRMTSGSFGRTSVEVELMASRLKLAKAVCFTGVER